MVVALCVAPASHGALSMKQRCMNALCGFLLLDLYSIMATAANNKKSWRKGASFLAPQTRNNLQSAALAAIAITLSKDAYADYWKSTGHRLSEISIEEYFGRLRVQSVSAQLSARAYFKAAVIEGIKHKPLEEEVLEADLPCLSNEEFSEVADAALEASLVLVSATSEASKDSILSVYQEWCATGTLDTELLGATIPPEEAEDEFMEYKTEAQISDKQECQELFDVLGSLSVHDFAEDSNLPSASISINPPQVDLDLREVPDMDALKSCLQGEPSSHESVPDKNKLPCTLADALMQVENGRSLFDAMWRLTAFLRHGHLGFLLKSFHVPSTGLCQVFVCEFCFPGSGNCFPHPVAQAGKRLRQPLDCKSNRLQEDQQSVELASVPRQCLLPP